jgi:two-component system NtrC family sensor kinase
MLRFLHGITAPDNRERLLWAVRVRWLVIVGFFALAVVAQRMGVLPSVASCAWAAAVGAWINAANHWCVTRGRLIRLVTVLALPGDVLLISFVVVSTGGVESPFVMMYVVQVVATAMLVDFAAATASALASVLCFMVGLWWQGGVLLTAAVLGGAAASPALAYQALWAAVLLYCLGLLAFLGGYISERLRRSERDLAEKHERLQATVASLRQAHAELAATCERLKATEAQLVHSEKMRALGQFVAGIAHELNNPISFVAANIEHLQRFFVLLRPAFLAHANAAREAAAAGGPTASREARRIAQLVEDLPTLLRDCEEGARRATGILSSLRAFSRGSAQETWELADLHRGLDRTVALVRHRLGPEVQVECEYGVVPAVECLPGQLDQVFLNLLLNAADAVGSKGHITVQTMLVVDPPQAPERGSHVAIVIRDDGVGIPASAMAHVFDPFFTTKEVGKGTGLGLSVSYGIVGRHGGTIAVDSAPGSGSTFTVYVPVRRRQCVPAESPAGAA